MNDDLNKDVFRKRIDKLSPEQKEQLKKMLLQKKQKDNSASERIIPKSSKADVFPLSFSQERIYTTEKLFPNTSKYHCPGLMKAYGFIDTDIIERSLNIIADKHEIIKAVFFERDGSCYYRIDTTAKIIPEYYDLSEPNHQSPSIDDIVRKSIHQTFDLYKGPLVRLVIIKMKNDEILFINNFHHIIYDLLSAHIFIRDLFNVYKALKNSELLPENKPLIQYYDYSLWQRELFKSGKFNDSIAYWEKKLAGAPQFLKLLDQGKISDLTEDSSNRNEMITFTIPETLLDQIQSFCKGHDITVFALFFSVLNMLIFRYTGQNDILLGIPVNGRNTPDAWNLIGCFINTLAIRTIIDENTSCFDLLRSVKMELNEAIKHQDAPFEKVVEKVIRKRTIDASPLVQILFNFIENPPSDLYLENVDITTENLHTEEIITDFEIEIVRHPKEFKGYCNFRKEIFDTEFVQGFIQHFTTLTENIVTNPAVPVKDVKIMNQQEQNLLIKKFNKTTREYDKKSCLDEMFEQCVMRFPNNTCIVDENKSYTYKEVNLKANTVAGILLNNGIGTGDIVAVMFSSSIEYFISVLGILKAGGAFLPIDISTPEKRVEYILEDSHASVLLYDKHKLGSVNFDNVVQIDIDYNSVDDNETSQSEKKSSNELAYVIYTSGSTGKPKGVMVEHKSLVNLCNWSIKKYSITEMDRSIQYYGLGFDASLYEIFPLLISGSSIYLISEDIKYNIHKLNDFITKNCITLAFLTTRIYELFKTQENKTLRYVIIGGEKLLSFQQQNYQLVNCYGPTECTVVSTSFDVKKDMDNFPIGKPIDNTEVYILDKQRQVVPVGVFGDIFVSGDLLARGYCNGKNSDDYAFMHNAFFPGKRMYKTGDIGRWLSDGNIEFTGRTDNQVKIRGMRIELGEIQYAFLRVKGVQQAEIILQNNDVLCAYVIIDDDLSIDSIRSAISDILPGYMIPDSIMKMDSFPLTLNGKINHAELPPPEHTSTISLQNKIYPRNKFEVSIEGLWKRLLDFEFNIGIDENFFDIGGNSILLVKLIFSLKKDLNIDLSFNGFMMTPTIRFIGSLVAEEKSFTSEDKFQYNEDLSDFEYLRNKCFTEDNIECNSVFLTGATGFLGSFLLYEFLKNTNDDIYCLIRCENESEGHKRILEEFTNYQLLISSDEQRRIHIIPGDLDKQYFGLSLSKFESYANKIKAIYHNAAFVNHILPYEYFKESNVNGMKRIIHFALLNGVEQINYISSLGVFSDCGSDVISEETPVEEANHSISKGYNTSKWVAERLLKQSEYLGLKYNIFRPGRIIGHSETGIGNRNDYFYRFIDSCIRIDSYPEGMPGEYIFPVDFTAKAIVMLSQKKNGKQNVFHLCLPKPMSLSEFLGNTKIKNADNFNNWLTTLLNETEKDPGIPITPYIPIFKGVDLDVPKNMQLIDSDKTMNILRENNILPEWTYTEIINSVKKSCCLTLKE